MESGGQAGDAVKVEGGEPHRRCSQGHRQSWKGQKLPSNLELPSMVTMCGVHMGQQVQMPFDDNQNAVLNTGHAAAAGTVVHAAVKHSYPPSYPSLATRYPHHPHTKLPHPKGRLLTHSQHPDRQRQHSAHRSPPPTAGAAHLHTPSCSLNTQFCPPHPYPKGCLLFQFYAYSPSTPPISASTVPIGPASDTGCSASAGSDLILSRTTAAILSVSSSEAAGILKARVPGVTHTNRHRAATAPTTAAPATYTFSSFPITWCDHSTWQVRVGGGEGRVCDMIAFSNDCMKPR